jgi:hypothetical protein
MIPQHSNTSSKKMNLHIGNVTYMSYMFCSVEQEKLIIGVNTNIFVSSLPIYKNDVRYVTDISYIIAMQFFLCIM